MTLPKTRPNDEIPTASMADIAFLLVVYFMLVLTFASTAGLDFELPKDDPHRPIERQDSVLIEVLPDGGLEVDGRPQTVDQLIDSLRPVLEQDPLKPVIVRTDPRARYESMVAVLDELRQAQAKGLREPVRIAIPTEREIATYWPD